MSLTRSRNSQHKVYIPASARESQYLLAKFYLSDELLDKHSHLIDLSLEQPYKEFYQTLASLFFRINESLDLESGQFIANDKFPRIRFSPEKLTPTTDQQLLFLYNPKYHHSQSKFFDGGKIAKKITLLFLANDDDVRAKSSVFHKRVKQAIAVFSDEIGLTKTEVRVCDHQHLTYDLFAKEKGFNGTQAHKLRSMKNRYAVDDLALTDDTDYSTYAIVDLPINRRMRSLVDIDESSPKAYDALYTRIANAFISSAKKYHLNNGAMIANGLIPIVRRSDEEVVKSNGELQMLGYNPANHNCGYLRKWSNNILVDTVQFVFVASDGDKTSHGYGKFLNQIENALNATAEQLNIVKIKEEMVIRFHQHMGFFLAE